MKKLGFIKNIVLEHITKASVENVLLILIVDVKWSSLESRVLGSWWTKALPTTCMKLNTHLRSMPIAHGVGIVSKFM
jgi:hypothetical protein